MSVTITVTHWSGSPSEKLDPETLNIRQQLNDTGACSFELRGGWYDRYADESDDENALQLHSLLTVTRDGTDIYVGQIFNKDISIDRNERSLRAECIDRVGVLSRYVPTATTQNPPETRICYYHTSSKFINAPNTDVYVLHTDTFYNKYVYPDPTDADLWLPISGSPRAVYTALSANINNSVTTIPAGTAPRRMSDWGLIKINSEIIYYEGYGLNSLNTAYEFKNCKRGVLGTTAAAHSVTDEINQWVPKRFATAGSGYYLPVIQWNGGTYTGDPTTAIADNEGGYWYLPDATVTTNSAAGSLTLSYIDEINAGGTSGGTSYQTVENKIDEWMAAATMGGWTEYDVDIPNVVLSYFSYDGRTGAELLADMLRETDGKANQYDASYTDHPIIAFWHNYSDDKLYVHALNQEATGTLLINPVRVRTRYSMADVSGLWGVRMSGRDYGITGAISPEDTLSQVSQFTNTYSSTEKFSVFNVRAHNKTRGTWGTYPGTVDMIGDASPGMGRSVSAKRLRSAINLSARRVFTFNSLPETMPELGKTYECAGYTGIATEISYNLANNEESLALTLVDLTDSEGVF
jgi:hypothetical protein